MTGWSLTQTSIFPFSLVTSVYFPIIVEFYRRFFFIRQLAEILYIGKFQAVFVRRQNVFWQTAFWHEVNWQTAFWKYVFYFRIIIIDDPRMSHEGFNLITTCTLFIYNLLI